MADAPLQTPISPPMRALGLIQAPARRFAQTAISHTP
jgi:hypothetical protein